MAINHYTWDNPGRIMWKEIDVENSLQKAYPVYGARVTKTETEFKWLSRNTWLKGYSECRWPNHI